MFRNLLQKVKAKGFLSGWGISLLIILVGVTVGLLVGWVPGGTVVGIGIGWGLSNWLVRRTIIKPLEQLVAFGENPGKWNSVQPKEFHEFNVVFLWFEP